MKVRLVKKHAELIDGVDLSASRVGDIIDLSHEQARLLLAEEWAVAERRHHSSPTGQRRRSDDRSPRRKAER